MQEESKTTMPRSEVTHVTRKRSLVRSMSPVSEDETEPRHRFPKRPVTTENKVLAIFGLHLDVTEQDLDGLYRPYGATFTKIIMDRRVSPEAAWEA